MRYKGIFRPRNISKYRGDYRKIIYRSLMELRFMQKCDEDPNILRWASEEVIIPYLSPLDGKCHRYFPDFWIKTTTRETLIEIKPKVQTRPPRAKPNKRRYLNEMRTWYVNEAKWKAAKTYCDKYDWTWAILTEKDISLLTK